MNPGDKIVIQYLQTGSEPVAETQQRPAREVKIGSSGASGTSTIET